MTAAAGINLKGRKEREKYRRLCRMKRRFLRAERMIARLLKIWEERRNRSGQVYVSHRVSEYREMWRGAVKEIGASFTPLTDGLWEVTRRDKRVRISNDILEFDNPVILEMAGMKALTYRLFRENGLRVPDHQLFQLETLETAERFLKTYPNGCVVKPANGTSSGRGVTTHLLTRKELKKAAILASLYCREMLIEPMIPGECYRLLVLNGKVIDAVCRRGPRLQGDGVSTVADLIRAENVRHEGTQQPLLDIDRDCLFTLGYQQLDLTSVPGKGERFIVKSVNDPRRKQVEVRTVYNETVTDRIGPAMKADAEAAARILGSEFIGVDFITPDPTVPLEKSGGVINEVNTTPGLHHHYRPEREPFPRVAVAVLEALLSRK